MNAVKPSSILQFLRNRWAGSSRSPLNCWFCNEDQSVELESRDLGWTCSFCSQYNGFNEDGDYNCPIKDQYESPKERKAFCQQESFHAADSILCHSCNRNQVLKIGQLASFVPLVESNYDAEVDDYKEYLESVYRLCQQCRDKLKTYLENQDEKILSTLDQEHLQIREKSTGENLPPTKSICERSLIKLWRKKILFSLCFLMSVLNLLPCIKPNLLLLQDKLCGWFPLLHPHFHSVTDYLLPWQANANRLTLSVYFGATFCVLALLIVGKTCIYIVDACHIVLWLFLLISNAVTSLPVFGPWIHRLCGINSPVYLILSLATFFMALICGKKLRLPRNVLTPKKQASTNQDLKCREQSAGNKEKLSESEKTACEEDNQESFSSSALSTTLSSTGLSLPQTPTQVGEAHNFFQPIHGSPPSSPSFSSSSFKMVSSPEKSQNAFETVRNSLESFSLGLRKKSDSISSIWSVPSIVSPESPSSPDSTSMPTCHQPPHNRNILSPSRLSFLSFSQSPSPGKFSSSSPTSEVDGAYIPNFHQYREARHKDHQSRTAKLYLNRSQECLEEEANVSSSFPSIPQSHRTAQLNKTSTVTDAPIFPRGDIHSLPKQKKVVAVPDSSTANQITEKAAPTGPRRSNRIAMRGKIIKPWPLKKSWSVNDMYDRSHNFDYARRPKGNVPVLSDSESGNAESGFYRYKPVKTDSDSERENGNDGQSSAMHFHKNSSVEGLRKRDVGSMDRIAEFSDDEEMDTPWKNKGKRILRGNTAKPPESHVVWTIFGLVIGISCTINAFLMWNLWMQQSSKSSN